MKTSELVFVGIRGSVVALNRATGQRVWVARLKGSGFVNAVLDDRRILATTHGEIFCLDPRTGQALWQNRLPGFGLGLATVATEKAPQNTTVTVMAEKQRQDEDAAAGAAAGSTAVM
jgi:outer membrane protein assembly factor BamB